MEKVFGIGFSKTGTTSLEEALQTLGYNVCRGHWAKPYTFYSHALWIHRDYDALLKLTKLWDAFADAPWGGTNLYEKLYEKLPQSKFILTVRDAEKWYDSLIKLLTMFDLNLETALDSYYSNGMYGSAYFFSHVFGIDTLAGTKQQIIDRYNDYNAAAIEFFRRRPDADFIVMDFAKGDGWEKLCKLLDKPVPPIPFPHENQAVHNPYLSNQVAQKRHLIVNVHIGRPADIESARTLRQALAQFGYEVVEISLAEQQAATDALNTLLRDRSAEIFCFVSSDYSALLVTGAGGILLHEMTGIPLVIMMHDHPLHFLPQQTPYLRGSLAFVPGDDSKAFAATHYPATTVAIANTGALSPIEPEVPDFEQFKHRTNAIFAPLSLNINDVTLDAAWANIQNLPPARRAFAVALAEAAMYDVATPLHELAKSVSEKLTGDDAIAGAGDFVPVFTFIKLWRRDQMVRALIDLPILVSTDFVPLDLQLKYPNKFARHSPDETVQHFIVSTALRSTPTGSRTSWMTVLRWRRLSIPPSLPTQMQPSGATSAMASTHFSSTTPRLPAWRSMSRLISTIPHARSISPFAQPRCANVTTASAIAKATRS